jgi:carboxymethylenebutenolidase
MSPVPGAVADPGALRTQDVAFESEGATIEAYVARPEQEGRHPAVIVIHEAFGPVEHIHDVARRFAAIGYVAMAPNLYSREGAPIPGDMEDLLGKMFGADDRRMVADLEAAAAWLRADGEATGKVGVIGFCSGGRAALLFASSSAAPDAVVDCWGGFVHAATFEDRTSPTRPTPVVELVGGLSCPLLAVGGAEDENPSPADMEALRAALEAAGKQADVRIFDGAGHAFFADYRPEYREEAAHRLWPVVTGFFAEHLR